MALVLPFTFRRPIHPKGNVSLLASQLRVPGPVVPTTFDPAKLGHGGSFTTLSNGNLTATSIAGLAGDYGNAGVTSSKSSGKYTYSFTFDSAATGADTAFGFGDASFDWAGITQFFSSAHSVAWRVLGDGTAAHSFQNGSTFVDLTTINGGGWSQAIGGVGHEHQILIDIDNLKLYLAIDGSPVFGMDPTAGTGGISIAISAPFTPGLSHSDINAATFKPSPAYAPTGYSTWDVATVSNNNIVGSSTLAFSPTATLLGSGAVSASSTLVITPSATLLGLGAVSGSSTLAFSPSGTVSGLIAGTSTLLLSPSATLLGAGAISGASALSFTPSGTVNTTMSGASSVVFSPSATLLGRGAVSGSSTLAFTPSATLLGAGAVVGSSAVAFAPTATLLGSGPVVGSSTLAFVPSATLLGRGAVLGSSTIVFSPSATMFAPSAISGAATLTFGGSGTLLGAGVLLGSTALTFAGSGTLLGMGQVTGQSSINFTASAVTSGGIDHIIGSTHLSLTLFGEIITRALFVPDTKPANANFASPADPSETNVIGAVRPSKVPLTTASSASATFVPAVKPARGQWRT